MEAGSCLFDFTLAKICFMNKSLENGLKIRLNLHSANIYFSCVRESVSPTCNAFDIASEM